MFDWCDKLKLGKRSVFVKREMRVLPLTEAEFEADFFLDPVFSTKRHEHWRGMVIDREFNGLLAVEDVQLPPPTVNDLATLLAHAMRRPPDYEDRQRPRRIHLRDRPQWQQLLPHLQQLGIEVVLSDDLPWFDEAVIDWMQHRKSKTALSADEIKATLRKPFPERKRTWFTDSMDLMEWTDTMCKAVYPTRKDVVPLYDLEKPIPIHLATDELETILTRPEIAKTKKLRPRLEAMAAEGHAVELAVHDWSQVLLALCGTRVMQERVSNHLLRLARRIANDLAEALGIDGPP